MEFASILKESLDQFGAASGLHANPKKSNIFLCAVQEETVNQIKAMIGF